MHVMDEVIALRCIPEQLQRWSLGMDKYFHPTLYNGCSYLSMLWLKLNHVSKKGPWCHQEQLTSWAKVDPALCHHMTSPGHNMLKANLIMYIIGSTMVKHMYSF